MRFFKPIYYTFKPMSRQILVHYIVIGLLLTLSVGLVVKITKNKETLNNKIISDTTYTTTDKQFLIKDVEQDSDTFGYEKLIGSLIALGFAWLSYKSTTQHTNTKEELKRYQEDNVKQHEEIKLVLATVIEQADKDKVVKELEEITKLVTGIVDNIKCQVLLESIGVRAQQFVMDVMTDELNHEQYDFSVIKINSKCSETIRQIKDMGFSKEFQVEFIKLQEKHTTELKNTLHDIMIANIVNHKYLRFGGAVKDFLKNYSRDIVRLHGVIEKT